MTLTGMHFRHFFQNAYVTRDLARAEALIGARHGIGEWVHFEPEMDVFTATDGQGMAHVKVALGWAGNLQIELIEPVSGNVQHYLDRLPADEGNASPQFHHICMRVADWDATMALVEGGGWPVAYRGGVPGCEFVYIDARDSLGHYVEYMWMSDEMWAGSGGPAEITG
ncbi:MAG: VOC family protein [Sphingomonadaceae bacterium]|jgi:hypothetical protein